MADQTALRARLAELLVNVRQVQRATMFEKAAAAEAALVDAVILLGLVIDHIEALEKEKQQ